MADNVTLPGTGAVIGTETVSAAQVQQVKVLWGAVDTGTEVATATPLPVVQTGASALPTGASTSAKQPALGVAGTASTDVITVQGIASGTPQAISGTVAVSGTVPVSGTFFQGTQPVSMSAVPTGAALDATVGTLNTNFGAQADVAATADTGSFSFLAYFKRSVAKLTAIVTALAGGLPAALGAHGGLVIEGVASGVAVPVSIASNVAPGLNTTGGWTPFHNTTLVNTPVSIKASTAGQIGGVEIFNTNAAVRCVKVWDKASSPTVGTDVPKKTYVLQPTTGLVIGNPTVGSQYALGIWVAVTTGAADTDNTAGSAGDIILNISYN